jgi:hypothetical protein
MSSSKHNTLVYIVFDPDAIGHGEDGFPGTVALFKSKKSAKNYKTGYRYEILHSHDEQIEPKYCYRIINNSEQTDELIKDIKSGDSGSNDSDSEKSVEAHDMDSSFKFEALWIVGLYDPNDGKERDIDYINEFEPFMYEADARRYAEVLKNMQSKKKYPCAVMCQLIDIFSDKFAEDFFDKWNKVHTEAKKSNSESSSKSHSKKDGESSKSHSSKSTSKGESSSTGSKSHKK